MTERRVGGDSRAEQRCDGGGVEVRRHTQRELLVERNVVAVSAKRQVAVLVLAVVSPDGGPSVAILFLARFAGSAFPARIHHAAYSSEISGLEFTDGRTYTAYFAHNFMSRNHRIESVAPFIASLVNIGMADSTKLNIEEDIGRARVAMFICEWCRRSGSVLDSVAFCRDHSFKPLSRSPAPEIFNGRCENGGPFGSAISFGNGGQLVRT